ncbi:phospholipase [Pseudomonas sp. MDT1-17]
MNINKLPDFEYGSHPQTLHDWMSNIPVIDNLTLGELILPGAHNSGSDKKGNYVVPGAQHWFVCQNNSFYYQLINGARALDLRLDYEYDNSRGHSAFYFHHNGTRSYRELFQLTHDVNRFLNENPDEFVILDFHKLDPGNRPFNFKLLSDRLLDSLRERIIPYNNSHKTLGELKRLSRTQRVLLAADRHPDFHAEAFSNDVPHKWSGSGLTNVSELKTHITEVMKRPPSDYRPWSLSATAYVALGGPVDIQKELNEWFDVKNKWIHDCSIINVDFFEESNLVMNCRAANIIKANNRYT